MSNGAEFWQAPNQENTHASGEASGLHQAATWQSSFARQHRSLVEFYFLFLFGSQLLITATAYLEVLLFLTSCKSWTFLFLVSMIFFDWNLSFK